MSRPRKSATELRSFRWFGKDDLRSSGHRSRARQQGFTSEDMTGKPVIAILNTWSDANPCHAHFRLRAEDVKRGVWQAGGFPMEIPLLTLGETFMKPTTMLYRNLLAMEAEEALRAYPADGAILLGGCDKTVPALVMGATSANIPVDSSCRPGRCFAETGAASRWAPAPTSGSTGPNGAPGTIDECTWREMEEGIARSFGTCMTMGTASTMAAAVDALGLTLPGASSIPAADSSHARMASAAGRRIVEMVWEDLEAARDPDDRGVRECRHGRDGARRIDQRDHPPDCDGRTRGRPARSRSVRRALAAHAVPREHPPVGTVPDGGLLLRGRAAGRARSPARSAARRLPHRQRPDARGELAGAVVCNDEVIRPRDQPIGPEGGVAVLRGNLAPDGAVIKHTAADPRLLRHSGPAVVFRNYNDLEARIDDPALPVTADSVLVLQDAGPLGAPGMPEWGMLPIPKKLLAQGVRDMVRISDARMSGTSYGACVLHVAPESFAGGPLAFVRDGDRIELDVPERRLTLCVPEDELARRRAGWTPREVAYPRGFGRMYARHVTQANRGCDFDFLEGTAPIAEPEIH